MTTIIPTSEEFEEEGLQQRNDAHMKEAEIREKPNFYAIIPAQIRYSDKLSWMEKILYAEITALCGREGYCFATNAYFARNYNVTPRTVQRAIESLNKHEFIFIIQEQVNGFTNRKIYLTRDAVRTIPIAVIDQQRKAQGGDDKNVMGGDKNVTHNSTSTDSTIVLSTKSTKVLSTSTVSTPPEEGADAPYTLPSWMGKTVNERLVKLYELLWERSMGIPTKLKVIGKLGKLLKSALDEESEAMVALRIILHFEWRGVTGSSMKELKNLQDNAYPFSWIFSPERKQAYKVFIIKNMMLNTEEQKAKMVETVLIKLESPSE